MSGKIIPFLIGTSAIINMNIPSTSMEVRKREVDEKLTGISQEIINYIPNSPDDFVTNLILEHKFEFHYNNWIRKTAFKSNVHEIISDYGFNKVKHYTHSTIGGYFPNNLESVFPWKNFFGNTQRAYLMKEEIVSGTWGIEGRYPFLDKQVVQEFLWLSNDIKNSNYKSVIHNYLIKNNYPFVIKEKIGFNCGFTGGNDGFNKKDSDNLNTDKTPVGIPKNNRVDLIVKL